MKTIKDIPNYPGYAIDIDGNVYSQRKPGRRVIERLSGKWRIMQPGADKDGYLLVILQINGIKHTAKVHHLVLETFVGSQPEGYECSHKNSKCDDNRLSNLEWVTHPDNLARKKENGTYQYGEKNPNAKLTKNQVFEIRKLYFCEKVSRKILGNQFGVSRSHISRIVRFETWNNEILGVEQ